MKQLAIIAVLTVTTAALADETKLIASDGAQGDHFGSSASVDGDTAVIGAPGLYYDSGSAYVFTRDEGGAWNQQAKLIASDGAEDDDFGHSVSVDGDTAVIGAHSDDDSGSTSGSAYVFTRDLGGAWSQQSKLIASDGAQGDCFGKSVSVDGNTAVIGAYFDDDTGPSSGSAYVFTGPPWGSKFVYVNGFETGDLRFWVIGSDDDDQSGISNAGTELVFFE